MAFCGNCGIQMQDGVKFCTACGKENGEVLAQQAQPRHQQQSNQPQQTGENGLTLTIAGKTLKLATIFKIFSGMLILFFFIPNARARENAWHGLRTIYINGLDALFGSGGTVTFPALIVFLIPITMLVMFIMKVKPAFLAGKLFHAAVGLCALGMLFNIIYISAASSNAVRFIGGSNAYLQPGPAFLVTMLLYLVGIGIAVYGIKASKNK